MSKKAIKGWVGAVLTAIIWAGYALTMRVGISYFHDIHPITFILQSLIISSVILLVLSGPGKLSLETLRNSFTWTYGTLQILNNIFLMAAFTFSITATSATLLLRVGIIISVLLNFFKGKNEIKSFLGFSLILLGLIIVYYGIDSDYKNIAVFLVFLSAFSQVMQLNIASNHKENNQATGDIKTELRVTGYIVAVTATFYAFLLLISLIAGLDFYLPDILPTIKDFFSLNSFGLATFTGIFIISTMKYFEFYSTKTIGSFNFLTIVAFTPLLTIILEKILGFLEVLDISILSKYDLLGCIIIVLGALINVRKELFIKTRNKRIAPKTKKDLFVLRDTIRTARICFNDDEEKVAETLGVGKRTINKIMAKDTPVSQKIKDKIIFNHASQIASLDHLTGAMNKSSFFLKLRDLKNIEQALIMFIDLNKFKPVNDTYGHEAGDSILKGIADRLIEEFRAPHVVARLGGDEYCLIIYGAKYEQEKKYISKVKKIINEPFIVEGIKEEISVGCAVGAAHYPTEGTNGHILKEVADKRMYEDKGSRER